MSCLACPSLPLPQVVILSPDAEEPLLHVDPGRVYVIGGIVDRTVVKGATARFAVSPMPCLSHFQRPAYHPLWVHTSSGVERRVSGSRGMEPRTSHVVPHVAPLGSWPPSS